MLLHHKKSIVMTFFCLLTMFFPIYSDDGNQQLHVISSYSFDIPGKTSERAVRREIVPPEGDPPYTSESRLNSALDRKRRDLFNMRIFNSVTYTYEAIYTEDGITYYHAHFVIDDSFTFLPIPYGKFDSNYGFRLGLKAYERNLFGSFANLNFVGHVSQIYDIDEEMFTWDSKDYFSELRISNISFGSSKLDLFVNLNLHQEENLFREGDLETRLSWSNIKLFNNTLTHESRLYLEKDKADFSQWRLKEYRIIIDIGRVHLFGEPFRLYNRLRVRETDMTLLYPNIEFFTRLTWLGLRLFDHPYSLIFSAEQNITTKEFDLTKNEFTATAQSRFNIPLDFRYTASLTNTFQMTDTFFIPHDFRLSTSHIFTRGSIDWNRNFREGSQLYIRIDGDYTFDNEIEPFPDRFTFTARSELTTFWIAAPWLNISTRTLGFIAHRPLNSGFPRFLPNNRLIPAEQMRGILLRNFDENTRKLGLTFNLNVTFLPIKIDGLAESFLTPFFDFGVFDTSAKNSISSDDLRFFYTGGLEAHVIFDKYRSFPFRASVGVNLKDLNRHLQGDIDMPFKKIEREISISLDLFF